MCALLSTSSFATKICFESRYNRNLTILLNQQNVIPRPILLLKKIRIIANCKNRIERYLPENHKLVAKFYRFVVVDFRIEYCITSTKLTFLLDIITLGEIETKQVRFCLQTDLKMYLSWIFFSPISTNEPIISGRKVKCKKVFQSGGL